MSETRSKRDTLGTEVRNNSALRSLYVLGAIALGLGLILVIIGVSTANSVDAFGDGGQAAAGLAWEVCGGVLLSFGVLALVGGAIAHAVNWQIVNR